jgi:hypothetical protein
MYWNYMRALEADEMGRKLLSHLSGPGEIRSAGEKKLFIGMLAPF